MTGPLALRVPLMSDEPPVYFLSRLAARNFLRARQFAKDMGFTFKGVEHGDQDAIEGLAGLGGVSMDALDKNRLLKIGEYAVLKGQKLGPYSVRRNRFQICPACLKQDVAESDFPASLAVHGRVQWMLGSVETCEKHGLGLVTIAEKMREFDQDWSQAVAPIVERLDDLIDNAVVRSPSRLESYLLDRLEGNATNSWLDQMDYYAAEQTARFFGAMAMFRNSNSPFNDFEANKYTAGEIGFDIAHGGADGICNFLSELKRDQLRERKAAGQKTGGYAAIYGRFYNRLDILTQDSAFNAVREVVTEHIEANFPVEPGETILGKTITERRFHSVLTLTWKYQKSDKTIINLMKAEGLIDGHEDNIRDMLFETAVVEKLMDHMAQSVSLAEAQKRLNVTDNVMKALRKDAIIGRQCQETEATRDRYSISELDEFLARLFANAEPVEEDSATAVPLLSVSARVRCTISVIVRFILEGKLPWVGVRKDLHGLVSLRVNPQHVSELIARQIPDGVHALEAGTFLKIAPTVIRRIADRGLIKNTRYVDAVTGRKKMVLCPTDLKRFDSEYVTLFNLARPMGRQPVRLLAELSALGVEPAAETVGVNATFYRRADLPDAF